MEYFYTIKKLIKSPLSTPTIKTRIILDVKFMQLVAGQIHLLVLL